MERHFGDKDNNMSGIVHLCKQHIIGFRGSLLFVITAVGRAGHVLGALC